LGLARKDTLTIGILHGRIRLGSKRANQKALLRVLGELIASQPHKLELLVTPPYPFTGPIVGYYPEHRIRSTLRSNAEKLSPRLINHSTIGVLMRAAMETGINLLVGPVIERAGPRLYVTSFLINKYGDITTKYRKIAVTPEEEKAGISPGKEPGFFLVNGGEARVGVFIDEDLAYPEIFRLVQKSEVNIIIGFMLPYRSRFFKMIKDENQMITMEKKTIGSFLSVRSKETGLPIILIGGVVESMNSSMVAYMDTLPAEPEFGVLEDRAKSVNDTGNLIIVDVDIRHSRAQPLDKRITTIFKRLV
jgi:predicted amidohydrolase